MAAAASRFVAAHDPEFINTYRWAASLAETYPGDAGVVISLMCNHLKLAPGEAVFLPGREPARLPVGRRRRGHGQLGQRAARRPDRASTSTSPRSSRCSTSPTAGCRCSTRCSGPGGLRYPVPVEDFDLTRCELDAESGSLTTRGPQVLLCTEGAAVLASADGELR